MFHYSPVDTELPHLPQLAQAEPPYFPFHR